MMKIYEEVDWRFREFELNEVKEEDANQSNWGRGTGGCSNELKEDEK